MRIIFYAAVCLLLLMPGLGHTEQSTTTATPITSSVFVDLELQEPVKAPFPVPWTPGHKTKLDWSGLIDATWGAGLSSYRQIGIFTEYWELVDQIFPCFNGITDNWDALYDKYAPEISDGVSRGRMVGILDHMSMNLYESHTGVYVSGFNTIDASRGIPILVSNGLGKRAGSLGAAVTALDDSCGLVYRAVEDNPLGLEPGDILLGYDGRSWNNCLAELMEAELPISGSWGSSPQSFRNSWTSAVGANWHLFDTMDVKKFSTGEVVHLNTHLIDGYTSDLIGTDQLDVGVTIPNLYEHETVTWGVINRNGSRIGYVYVAAWMYTAQADFYAAINSLTEQNNLAGLIIDFRFNAGGNMHMSSPGLGLLFREYTTTIDFHFRCSTSEHLAMCSADAAPYFVIDGVPASRFYEDPIAVLVGPGAVSSGDQVALRMTYHPSAKTFGRSTAAAFNTPRTFSLDGNYQARLAEGDAAREDAPTEMLTHREFPVDNTVWLTPADAALGKDTVVDAAAAWILGAVSIDTEFPPDEIPQPGQLTGFLGASPNPFNPITEMVFSLQRTAEADLSIYDLHGRLVRRLESGKFSAGEHRTVWDGCNDAGQMLPSGAYLVRLNADEKIFTGRVTLLK